MRRTSAVSASRAAAAALAVVLVAGCVNEPTGTSNESVDPMTPSTASSELTDEAQLAVDELARSVAFALAEPTARAATIRAMRGSPFHEHKLLLGTFLATEAGRAMMASAAARSGMASDRVDEALSHFPAGLDFYVASDGQRASWVGSGRLLVAGIASNDATQARAFDPDGNSIIISSVDVPGYDVVFSIHPAEAKVEARYEQSLGRINDRGRTDVFRGE